jgi:hypothetical protein
MLFNEEDFFPIWRDHYGRNFEYQNLFVIDDGSVDALSATDSRINVIRRERKVPFDEKERAKIVSSLVSELLNYYNYVIFTDVDEILVVNPSIGVTLKEYIERSNEDFLTPKGFNVLHRFSVESPLNIDEPLFTQRKYVQFDPWYCKTNISRVPLQFSPGFHSTDKPFNLHEKLYLFHLRAFDLGIAQRRLARLKDLAYSQEMLSKNFAAQWRFDWIKYRNEFFSQSELEFSSALENLDAISAVAECENRAAKTRNVYQGKICRIPESFNEAIYLRKPIDENVYSEKTEKIVDVEVAWTAAITNLAGGFTRNGFCACGSGEKLKHCHGKLK